MLDITVKTMDSQSRSFQVPENMSVKDFKARIAGSVNIPPDRQRLIFQGRVLADDFKLKNEHHEKVFHLVQRFPAASNTGSSRSTSTTQGSGTSQNTSRSSSQRRPQPNAQINQAQMFLQQALGGLGSVLGSTNAPSLITGTVRTSTSNPNNPNEPTMNIHIEMGNTPPGTNQANPAQPNPNNQGPGNQRNATVSAPRRQLETADRILVHLNRVLNQLANPNNAAGSGNATSNSQQRSSGPSTEAPNSNQPSGDVYAEDLNDERLATDNSNSSTSSSGSQPIPTTTSTGGAQPHRCRAHPSLGELGSVYNRMLAAQRQLEPYMTRFAEFLNTDPAFTSTTSPEYVSASHLIRLTLQAQRLLGELHTILSNAVIPLGRTPPRNMLVNAQQPRSAHHHHGNANNQGQRRFGAFVRPVRVNGAAGANQPGANVPFPAPNLSMPFQFRGNVPRPQQPPANVPVMSFASQAASNGNQTSASQGTAGSNNNAATQQSNASANSEESTVRFDSPQYTVNVNATVDIQPNINISVGPAASDNADTQAAPSVPSTGTSSSYSFTTSSPSQGTSSAIPQIPGVPQDLLNNMFGNLVQNLNNAQQAGSGGSNTGGTGGVFVVQGPPGGENQIPQDISNIIGQTLQNSVYSQLMNLAGGVQNGNQQTAPTNTTSSRASTTASSAQNNSMNDAPMPPADNSSSEPRSAAINLANLLSRGGFGGRPNQAGQNRGDNPSSSSPPISEILRSLVDGPSLASITDPQSMDIIDRIAYELANVLSIADMSGIISGSWIPFDRIQNQLRDIIKEKLFDNGVPSKEQVKERTQKLAEDLREKLCVLFDGKATIPDVDIVETNIRLFERTVREAIEIILFSGTNEMCAELNKLLFSRMALWIQLNEFILKNGRRELNQFAKDWVQQNEGGVAALIPGMNISDQHVNTVFDALTKYKRHSLEEIRSHIVNTATMDSPSSSQDHDDEATSSVSQKPQVQEPPKEEPKKEQKSPAPAVPAASKQGDDDEDDWKNKVPAEWVECISNDITKQNNQPPQPQYSEAYMAGMPASKRRKVVS